MDSIRSENRYKAGLVRMEIKQIKKMGAKVPYLKTNKNRKHEKINNKTADKLLSTFISKGYKESKLILN